MDSRTNVSVTQLLHEILPGVSTFQLQSIGGGSINETFRLNAGKSSFFLKVNDADTFPRLFEKERDSLQLLAETQIFRTPSVIACQEIKSKQFLLMEWVDSGSKTDAFWKKFGASLAKLHRQKGNAFGWKDDNYMGSLYQSNRQLGNWIEFLVSERLEPLVVQCEKKGLLQASHRKKFESLFNHLPHIFDADQKPVLVHGDLWSGNFLCDNYNEPVLIDPATHYGHPAVDLGMTALFGGFSTLFYEAYQYHSSEMPDANQCRICNLYPLLVHLLLFGTGYRSQIESILEQFA